MHEVLEASMAWKNLMDCTGGAQGGAESCNTAGRGCIMRSAAAAANPFKGHRYERKHHSSNSRSPAAATHLRHAHVQRALVPHRLLGREDAAFKQRDVQHRRDLESRRENRRTCKHVEENTKQCLCG